MEELDEALGLLSTPAAQPGHGGGEVVPHHLRSHTPFGVVGAETERATWPCEMTAAKAPSCSAAGRLPLEPRGQARLAQVRLPPLERTAMPATPEASGWSY
jgi:hypothetical protein